MTQRSKDDLAAALAGLHSGEHQEVDDQGHEAQPIDDDDSLAAHSAQASSPAQPLRSPPPPPQLRAPARPASASAAPPPAKPPRPSAPVSAGAVRPAAGGTVRNPSTAAQRPASPAGAPAKGPVRPAAPGLTPAANATRPVRPASPARPTGPAPAARPAAPPVRADSPAARPPAPVRPAAPLASAETAEDIVTPTDTDDADFMSAENEGYDEPEVIDEDDMVIVPAPPMEALGHFHQHDHVPAGPARRPSYQNIGYRQTIIPVLLTTGFALFVLGAAHWVVDPDSPLGLQGLWFPALLMVMGTVALGLGVLSMLQIRHMLETGNK